MRRYAKIYIRWKSRALRIIRRTYFRSIRLKWTSQLLVPIGSVIVLLFEWVFFVTNDKLETNNILHYRPFRNNILYFLFNKIIIIYGTCYL